MTKNPLAITHPELIKQWHHTKNILTPFDVTFGSNKKAWWKCPAAEDHEWESAISNRSNGTGCPFCCGLKTVLSNCLSTTHPELSKQWHPTKNFPLTPFDVVAGTIKKVWWKCPVAEDHEWKASIRARAKGNGCSCCCGRSAVLSNCLATTHPEIAKQWHSTKNKSLTPFDVSFGSNKKVWWKCPKADDHEWESVIYNRTVLNIGCPCCVGQKTVLSNCLATTYPEIADQWHPTKNGKLTPFDVVAGSGKKVWWKCKSADDHEWIAPVSDRSNGRGCPCCAGHKAVLSNCLATTHPEIAAQWHPTKNFPLTPFDIGYGSEKIVWWICNKADDHEWKASLNSRTSKGSGCSCCSGHKVVLSNCLSTTHPEIAKEWHPTKNLPLTPLDITYGSGKNVWWKCDKENDHEWEINICNRIHNGCPYCNESHGEKEVKNILDKMNIYYDIEKTFDGCKYKNKLPFDFYLPKYNALIEYDGMQHFKPIKWFGGIKGLKSTQKRDKIKNEFADKNNIRLLRIPYTKFDSIEEEIMALLLQIKTEPFGSIYSN